MGQILREFDFFLSVNKKVVKGKDGGACKLKWCELHDLYWVLKFAIINFWSRDNNGLTWIKYNIYII